MHQSRFSRLSIQLFLADLALIPLALWAAALLRSVLPVGRGGALVPESTQLPWYVYLIITATWSLGLVLSGLYDPERVLRWYGEAAHILWGCMLAGILAAGLIYFAYREMPRLEFMYFGVLCASVLLAYRAGMRVYYRLGHGRAQRRSRILVIGAGVLGRHLAKVVLDQSRWGFDLVGYLDDDPAKLGLELDGGPVLAGIDALGDVVAELRVDELWIALPARANVRLEQAVMLAEKMPVRIKIAPGYLSMALVRARTEIVGGLPLIGLREPVIEGANRLFKRAFDLVVGSASLLVASLPMAVIAVLIRLDTPGPILFRQKRVGENGRLFDMLKFRTMVANAEQLQDQVVVTTDDGNVIHKTKSDPRVTRVGRFLRRFSLDELPQLFNVLRGDMSMVGPRPEMPWLVDRYKPWQRKRFAVPQGITGWWQVHERSDKPMHLNTEDDMYYVYNYSLWLDLQILLMTPLAVLRGRGAF